VGEMEDRGRGGETANTGPMPLSHTDVPFSFSALRSPLWRPPLLARHPARAQGPPHPSRTSSEPARRPSTPCSSGALGGAGLQADLPATVDAMKAGVLAWQAAETVSISMAVGTSGGLGPGHWRGGVGRRPMPFGDGNDGNGSNAVAANRIPLPPRALMRPPIPRESPSMSPRDAPCSARDNLNSRRGDLSGVTGSGNDENVASHSRSLVGRGLGGICMYHPRRGHT